MNWGQQHLTYFFGLEERDPLRLAVVDCKGQRKTTYRELIQLVNALGNALLACGLKPGDVVALDLGRTMEHHAARLACLATGMVFVSLSKDQPARRQERIIRLSRAKRIVDDEFAQAAAKDFATAPCCWNKELADSDPAFIVFTSGTTGKPKGIAHNRSIFELWANVYAKMFIPAMRHKSGSDAVSPENSLSFLFDEPWFRYASVSDPATVISLSDTAVLFGHCLHIVHPALLGDVGKLIGYFREHRINATVMIPKLLMALAPYDGLAAVIVGGNLSHENFGAIPAFRNTLITNGYGASECYIMGFGNAKEGASLAPLAASAHFELGENGELLFSGPGVMVGYLSEQGIENCGTTLHTGDFARIDTAGQASIVGRMDNTANIRGNRVAFEEVEYAISQLGETAEVAVTVSPEWPDALVALCVPVEGRALDEDALRKRLAFALPGYMIPTSFVPVDAFQHSAAGKIIRTNLSDLIPSGAQNMVHPLPGDTQDTAHPLPGANADEQAIVELFNRVLNTNRATPTSTFASLGGDSLSALYLQEQFSARFTTKLSANRLMALGSPRAIAQALSEPAETALPDVSEAAYTFDDLCPLTESQWNIYLGSATEATTRYNIPAVLPLGKRYSFDQVSLAAQEIASRHPALTGRIVVEHNMPFLRYDCAPVIERGSAADAQAFVRPFDLQKGLARMLYVEDDAGDCLYVDYHHLIADGTSISLVAHELFELLESTADAQVPSKQQTYGRMSYLASNATALANSVDTGILRQLTFEQLVKETPAYQAAGAFFDNMLCDAENINSLLPSPFKARHRRLCFDPFATTSELALAAAQKGITLSQLLTVMFAYVLSVFSHDKLASFCAVEDGRGALNLGQSVGMFTRTVPLAIDCGPQTLDNFLQQGAHRIRHAFANDFYPLRLISSHSTITSSIQFQYAHDLLEYSEALNSGQRIVFLKELAEASCDLSFEVDNRDGQLYCIITHSEAYSDELCQSMHDAYVQAFSHLKSAQVLSDLCCLPPAQAAWLDEINRSAPAPQAPGVIDLFNNSLAAYPHRAFVAGEGIRYSYAQAAWMIKELADIICAAQNGENASRNVLVFTGRNHRFALAVWAVVASHGTYVPLEPDHPDNRISYVATCVQASSVLVDDETAQRAHALFSGSAFCPRIINVQHIEQALCEQTGAALEDVGWKDEDALCILFTSGSTGNPKGVEIPHRAFSNMAANYTAKTAMSSQDVYSLYTPLSFDMHTLALFCSVYAGACITVVPGDVRLDLRALDSYFQRMGTTHTCMTTHVGKLFVQAGFGRSLEHLLVIGETLGEFTAPDYLTMWESYGPTESLALVTMVPVNARSHSSSVGWLFGRVRSYVLDRFGRRAPVGAVGDLHLSGRQLAQGYYHHEALTQAAFGKNNFDGVNPDFARMYKTGDIARYLPDGTIGFIGRNDGQVKIRGNRVELEEVEAALLELSFVADAAVAAVSKGDSKELAAYVVMHAAAPEALLDANELAQVIRQELQKSKPAYMAPAYVLALEALPLNANGKVDKRNLPAIEASALQREYELPQDDVESKLCDCFAQVLGMSQVGASDDFLALGGDSLSAMRLAWLLDQMGLACSALDILQKRSPRALAEIARCKQAEEQVSPRAEAYEPVAKMHPDGSFVCQLTTTQMNFYDNEMQRDMGCAYVFSGSFLCPKSTTPQQAVRAVEAVLDAHPVLSGRICTDQAQPCIVSGGKPSVVVLDGGRPAQLQKQLLAPFNLEQGISRFVIAKSHGRVLIAHACHHIISDATSIHVLTQHLEQALQNIPLPKDVGFINLSNRCAQAEQSARFQKAQAYFARELSQEMVERHALGLHRRHAGRAGTLFATLPHGHALLAEFAQTSGIPAGTCMHAAFSSALASFTGFDTSVYKTGLHGRYDKSDEEALGCFADFTIVINHACQTPEASLGSASQLMLNVIDCSIYPYKLLKNQYPAITYLPFFEYVPVQLDYRAGKERRVQAGKANLLMKHASGRDEDQIADFTAAVYLNGDGLTLTIQHTSKYSQKELETLATRFFQMLVNMSGGAY